MQCPISTHKISAQNAYRIERRRLELVGNTQSLC
jgi:hypothetical protein